MKVRQASIDQIANDSFFSAENVVEQTNQTSANIAHNQSIERINHQLHMLKGDSAALIDPKNQGSTSKPLNS